MLLSHRIRLEATFAQRDYFARAAGTARRVWNWSLAEWLRQDAMGQRPNAMALKKQFIRLEGKSIVLPKFGRVMLAEVLRFSGKIMGANVSRTADHWYVAEQVELPEREAAKASAGIVGAIPKGVRLPVTRHRARGAAFLGRLHAHIAHVRADFTHQLTTRLCRENQVLAIEDLNVRGMLANHRLARAIADVGFYEIRRQLHYKAQRFGTLLGLADRWYPSGKPCSFCGARHAGLTLKERRWTCTCSAHHDRDVNAAINLQRLAIGALAAKTALAEASQAVTLGTAAGMVLAAGGKVTPVTTEYGQQDGSGQQENGAYIDALFR